jgi:hypothetical protein
MHREVSPCATPDMGRFWACSAADDLTEDRARGRSRVADVDPWLTEGRVVAAHAMLQKGQGRERAFLGEAFSRVRALEARRMNTIRTAIEVFLRTYKCGPVHNRNCCTSSIYTSSTQCMQKIAVAARGFMIVVLRFCCSMGRLKYLIYFSQLALHSILLVWDWAESVIQL